MWGFDFLPAIDPKTGRETPLSSIDTSVATAYTEGVSTGPRKYRCRIVPRSPQRVETFRREYEQATGVLDQYESG